MTGKGRETMANSLEAFGVSFKLLTPVLLILLTTTAGMGVRMFDDQVAQLTELNGLVTRAISRIESLEHSTEYQAEKLYTIEENIDNLGKNATKANGKQWAQLWQLEREFIKHYHPESARPPLLQDE